MRRALIPVFLGLTLVAVGRPPQEVRTGFDNRSNGFADDATHLADKETFDRVEDVKDGLGPLYNAQSCRECHQNPTSGGASQITELRVGHLGPDGRFRNPHIPIARGAEIITGRSLVNDRAICPNEAFQDTEVQERVPAGETIRTRRVSLNLLGDGFGTGYSSLAYLKRLPVDELKIDKSFVIGMASDPDDAVIVRSTIDLGHNMGLKVVAEGVENEAILNQLKAMGCDLAQGFLMSKPLPAKDFERWIRESPWGNNQQPDYTRIPVRVS